MDLAPRPKALMGRVRATGKDMLISAGLGLVLLWLTPCFLRCTLVYLGAIIFLANVIYITVVDYKPKGGNIPTSGKAVIITGCDSGFGHMLAQKLDDLGFQVFAGCLFPDGEGAQNLKKSASNRLEILKLDVSKDDDVEEAVSTVESKLGNNKIWSVVCNAGLNDGGELSWTNFETIKKVIDINMFGVVRVTKAFLPKIMESKGRIIAVASAAGRYTYPGMVPYCMSKQGVVSFCDGLRLELGYQFGVQVITVEPWMFRTNITEKETIIPYNKKAWDSAPENIKKLYPKNYVENFTKSILKFLTFSISEKPSEVVDCLVEAVTAKYPKYAYAPGTLYSRVSFWILRRLPKPIADLLIADTVTVPYTSDEK